MRKVIFAVNVLLALSLFVGVFLGIRHVGARARTTQNPQPNRQRQDLPVATYRKEDPRDTLNRGAAGQLEIRRRLRYNNRGFEIGSAQWNQAKITDASKSICDLPLSHGAGTLPLNQTDTIVIGRVGEAKAMLSADHTNIFSQFTIETERTIRGSLGSNTSISIERHGGAVAFPSGARVERGGCFNRMPIVGQTYLFFLQAQPETEDFKVLTAFEITKGLVVALDGTNSATGEVLPAFKRYDGQAVDAFISQLAQKGGPR